MTGLPGSRGGPLVLHGGRLTQLRSSSRRRDHQIEERDETCGTEALRDQGWRVLAQSTLSHLSLQFCEHILEGLTPQPCTVCVCETAASHLVST